MIENSAKVQPEPPAPIFTEAAASPAKKYSGFFTPKMVDVLAGVSSIAAAAATAWTYIEARAYKNISSLDAFETMKENRKKRFKIEIADKVDQGIINSEEAFQLLKNHIQANEQKGRGIIKSLGADSIVRRWQLMRFHQKAEALIWSGAAVGIALGAVLPLARSVFTREQQEELAQKAAEDALERSAKENAPPQR